MVTTAQRTSAVPMPRCAHQPPCPPATDTGRLAAIAIAPHPEQGWSLLCNGVIVFEDTGAIADGKIILPRRAAASPHMAGTGPRQAT